MLKLIKDDAYNNLVVNLHQSIVIIHEQNLHQPPIPELFYTQDEDFNTKL